MAVVKSLGCQVKKEWAFSKSTTWRHAGIQNLKQHLIELALQISIPTVEDPIEDTDRAELREYIEEFRLLCIDFIIPLSKS